MDGLLVIDKPVGPTSHDVVARVRKATNQRSVGHTGTLDPGASGVLPLVLGRATRLARFLSASDKSYEAAIELGVETDTYDSAGQPAGAAHPGPLPGRDEIERALDAFRGTFLQQPPAYSAKRVAGRRSYDIVRAAADPAARQTGRRSQSVPDVPASVGESTLPSAVHVTVQALELLGVEGSFLKVNLTCSAGFYVRSLAHDLGQRLGVGAHLAGLRRTRSGDLTLAHAIALETIERDPAALAGALVPLALMLPALSAVRLTEEGTRRARHGRDLGPGDFVEAVGPLSGGAPQPVRLLDTAGDLVGLAEPAAAPALLHPAVVLV